MRNKNSKNGTQPKWKALEYSKNQIEKAGSIIKNSNSSTNEIETATLIVDNWRESHAYPLHVIYIGLRTMFPQYIVAERLKRLDSIINKLKRFSNMSLWTIQDLGGCRVIVNEIDEVYSCADKYENSKKRHILKREYDYINHPKSSGYRSLHRVYLFHSDSKNTYNRNMCIEIQYRTHLQHLWATAVETMDLARRESIKTGQGNDDIKRFFILISSLFSLRENMPVVPGTSDNIEELVNEIKQINNQNNYLDMLAGIQVYMDKQDSLIASKSQDGYHILIFNYETRRIRIKYFKPSQSELANKTYANIESSRNENKIDAVLVRASSIKGLKIAYPNYFADIHEFIDIVNSYL